MRPINDEPTRAALACVMTLSLLAAAGSANAQTINVDFEDPNTTAHVGTDGILSGAGALWNPVVVAVDAFDLLDDEGAATSADVVFLSGGTPSSDPSSTNDLQDRGTFASFEVRGLDPNTVYDVSAYGGGFGFWSFTDSSGSAGAPCTGALTYALPGVEGGDYCLYLARTPADLGSGNVGFRFSGLDGVITGVQVRPPAPPLVTPVPALPPAGQLALAFLVVTGIVLARRRLHPPPLRR